VRVRLSVSAQRPLSIAGHVGMLHLHCWQLLLKRLLRHNDIANFRCWKFCYVRIILLTFIAENY
jgi:hypothetical protein